MIYRRLSTDMKRLFFYCLMNTFGIWASVNLALKKPARMSSTLNSAFPSRAVDGNTDGNYFAQSCAHTDDPDTTNTWWKVDLMGYYRVNSVQIFPRTDCCTYRLQQFEVWVSPVNPSNFPDSVGKLCAYYPYIVPASGITLNCTQPMTGRYVSVFKAANGVLTICEFLVFGLIPTDREDTVLQTPFKTSALENSRHSGQVFWTQENVSALKCASMCAQADNCFGFNIITSNLMLDSSQTCQLITYVAFEGTPVKESTMANWKFYFQDFQ